MKTYKTAIAIFFTVFFTATANAATVVVSGNSVIEIVDASIDYLISYEQSTVNFRSGGYRNSYGAANYSTANLFAGSYVGHVNAIGQSSINVYGGDTSFSVMGQNVTYLYGGNIGYVNMYDNSVVHIFGSNFTYSKYGILNGVWADGTAFSFQAIYAGQSGQSDPVYDPTSIVIRPIPTPGVPGNAMWAMPSNLILHAVPLPTTLPLMLGGCLMLACVGLLNRRQNRLMA